MKTGTPQNGRKNGQRAPAHGSAAVPARRRAKLRDDPYLAPFLPRVAARLAYATAVGQRLAGGADTPIQDIASGHEHFGLHRREGGWIFREWAPNASAIFLVGEMTHWRESDAFRLQRVTPAGEWELRLPADALRHGLLYRLSMHWPGGHGDRIPAWTRRVVQDPVTHIFNAQVWSPEEPFTWKHAPPPRPEFALIYEAHVGMAQERAGMGTYREFAQTTLPRIAAAGYNTIQLMAVMEHPYYGSFGYHVSSFFAASSRFGTPEELKELVDTAHGMGLRVVMDLVHSHASSNEVEGLSRFDGTHHQYFHEGARGQHTAWGSRCFDYGKPEVLHFLLSNCRFWLDEYRFDGFRFDGVTSMLYHDHGFGPPFTSYERYFDGSVDDDALAYLTLANRVIHAVRPDAVTVAEDVSGMPGLAATADDGGHGFDYRLAMGVPDCWFKLLEDVRDEDWGMGWIWRELTNRRADERTISYVECHDQAIVGGKTSMFQMADAAIYTHMQANDPDLAIDRAMALHKMLRLATVATAGDGYLNFMGNEFGHPEWVDFPREGNQWSYHYARRQWSLRDNAALKYRFLGDFDREMLRVLRESGALDAGEPVHGQSDDLAKLLVFERGPLLFAFNFHPSRSVTDHPLPARGAEYELALDTDARAFGGHGRLAPAQRYHSLAESPPAIRVYLPCRSALVLRQSGAST